MKIWRLPLFDLTIIGLFVLFFGMAALQVVGVITISWWIITAPITVPLIISAAVVLIGVTWEILDCRKKF